LEALAGAPHQQVAIIANIVLRAILGREIRKVFAGEPPQIYRLTIGRSRA
jgi:hypothetical protein